MAYTKILLYIIVAIILFSIVNFFFLTHPPKFKSQTTPADYDIPYKNVTFKTSDGLRLKGWLAIKNKTKPTIIIGHGYPFDKGNIITVTHFLYPRFNILLFDFRYFGESEGSYTTGGWKETKDTDAAVKFLKKQDIKQKFGALGFSLSASTFLLANSPDIKAIVADSPYATMTKMIERTYWFFPGFTKLPFVWLNNLWSKIFFRIDIRDISIVESVKDMKTPLLLIHGKSDMQIPVENSGLIYNNSNKNITELWIIEGAGHGFSYASNPQKYEKKVLEFFEKNLG